MNEIKVGMVVQLKSGGPLMTVVKVESGNDIEVPEITCQWFAGDKIIQNFFHPESLKIVRSE